MTCHGRVVPEADNAWRPLTVTLWREHGTAVPEPVFVEVPAVWSGSSDSFVAVDFEFGQLVMLERPASVGLGAVPTRQVTRALTAARPAATLPAPEQSGWYLLSCAVRIAYNATHGVWSPWRTRSYIVDRNGHGLPAPNITVVELATMVGVGTHRFRMEAVSNFTGDHTPRIECSIDTGTWTLCGGATWEGAEFELPGLAAGLHTLAARQVLGDTDPVRLVSNVTSLTWYVPDDAPPPQLTVVEVPQAPVYEPATGAIVRVDLPTAAGAGAYKLGCDGVSASQCEAAATPDGMSLYPHAAGVVTIEFSVVRSGTVYGVPVTVTVDILPNPVAVALTSTPAPLTRLSTADFRVAASTADGLACPSGRCSSYVCWTTFAPAPVACTDRAVDGVARASYADVPAGMHTFHVAVNDTGAVPTPGGTVPVVTHTASYVSWQSAMGPQRVSLKCCLTRVRGCARTSGSRGQWMTASRPLCCQGPSTPARLWQRLWRLGCKTWSWT